MLVRKISRLVDYTVIRVVSGVFLVFGVSVGIFALSLIKMAGAVHLIPQGMGHFVGLLKAIMSHWFGIL